MRSMELPLLWLITPNTSFTFPLKRPHCLPPFTGCVRLSVFLPFFLCLIFGEGKIEDELDPKHFDRYSFKRVHFLGHHSAEMLDKGHNIAKLSVAPSRLEGFGLAVLEAMACGLPVIVARNSGSESFAEGEIIDQESSQQLAAAIVKIATMRQNEYMALSELARKTANSFSWRNVAEERIKYYQQLPKIKYSPCYAALF